MNRARTAGIFYLLTIITGFYAYVANGRFAMIAGGIGGGCYLVVTVLLYLLFKPVNAWLSLVAAAISISTIVAGGAGLPLAQSLVFFGVYCVLIGYLILKSTFAPRVVGALMIFAGAGWLTFLSPRLATALSPYILIPGFLGEGSLTIWLLIENPRKTGVKVQ